MNWDNVSFPSSDVDIDTFEENNGGKVAVNVYFIDPDDGETIHFTLQTDQGSKGNSSNQSSKTGGWI